MAKRTLKRSLQDIGNASFPPQPVTNVIERAIGCVADAVVPPIRWAVRQLVKLRWLFLLVFLANTLLGTAIVFTEDHVWLIGGGFWIAEDTDYGLYAGHFAQIPSEFSLPPDRFHWWWTYHTMGSTALVAYRPMPMLTTSFITFWLALFAWIARFDERRRLKYLGKCPNCLYDRAGLASDAKCPECGATPLSAKR